MVKGRLTIYYIANVHPAMKMKQLIDHGAKVNSTNKKGATPLIIAAVKGHHSVLRILAFHPQIQLHLQVS
jgi:ankyrin repeat protein